MRNVTGATGASLHPGDYWVFITSTGATVPITLPADAFPGTVAVIKDAAGGAGVSFPIHIRGATGFVDGSPTGVVIQNAFGARGVVAQSTGLWLTAG